jgi:hypothetical protein
MVAFGTEIKKGITVDGIHVLRPCYYRSTAEQFLKLVLVID